MSNIPFEPKYTRFPFLVLPYSKTNMAVPRELMIDYDNKALYVKSEDGSTDIPLSDPSLKDHIIDYNNPHDVTKEQIGLGNVINVTQASKEEFDKHIVDYDNPHRVTKHHVGLGNVLNIMPASKEEFDDLKSKYTKLEQLLEELKNRPGHSTLYELKIDTEPPEAKVRVFYNNKWNDGKIHNVPEGEYSYEVFVSDDIQKFDLTINPYPIESDVYVFYNGTWNAGNNHLLQNGTYQVKVLCQGYIEKITNITVSDVAKTEVVRLDKIGYTLTINTIPDDCLVKVYYDGGYNEGRIHQNLYNGTYPVQVSKYGYLAKEEIITINNGNVTQTISLESNNYPLIVNVNPGDALVEVFYNSVWNKGTTHSLPNGEYDIKVSKIGYIEYTGKVIINNITKTENITLEKLAYNVSIVTNPISANVEIFYDGKWNSGKIHNIQTGSYNIRVSYPGYESYSGTISILNEDKVIPIDLSETRYSLFIQTTPLNATIKVKILGQWETSLDNIFLLTNGTYDYTISAVGYKTVNGSVSISGKSENVNVEMEKLNRLLISTNPIDAEVKVKINGSWVVGGDHWLEAGMYDIEIIRVGYKPHTETLNIVSDTIKDIILEPILYTLTVNTNPIDALVSVLYDNNWNRGNVHTLPNGTYDIKVVKDGYINQTVSTVISNSDKIENITLDIIKYNLTINTNPEDSVVEVEYDGKWNIGKSHSLPNGSYKVRVSRVGYITDNRVITILDLDKTETIELIKDSYTLTIETTPIDATVEIEGPSGYVSTNKINNNIISGDYTIRVKRDLYYTDTSIININTSITHSVILNPIEAPEDLNDESKMVSINIKTTPSNSSITLSSN